MPLVICLIIFRARMHIFFIVIVMILVLIEWSHSPPPLMLATVHGTGNVC